MKALCGNTDPSGFPPLRGRGNPVKIAAVLVSWAEVALLCFLLLWCSPVPSPAAAARSSIPRRLDLPVALLGLPDIYRSVLHQAMRKSGLYLTCLAQEQLQSGVDLTPYRVIYLHRDVPVAPARLLPALKAAADKGAKIVSLWPARGLKQVLNVSMNDYPDLKGYWTSPSVENLTRFLTYTAVTFLGRPGDRLPPIVPPPNGIYHPDAPQLFETLADYERWRPFNPAKPTVAILFFEFSVSTRNTDLLDALIQRLEKDANVLATYGAIPATLKPDAIVNQRVYGSGTDPKFLASSNTLDIQPVKITSGTREEWEKGPGLIGGSQLSAWVTVPELNGAIEPIVIGWRKQESSGARDLPLKDRIDKLARRLTAWLRLRRLPNSQKRVAIVHYNISASYLDVPKSLMNLLRAMRNQGYSVKVPKNHRDLLVRLLQTRYVRRADKAALRRLARDPSTAKIPRAQYMRWFHELPQQLQEDVNRWWGKPPGKSMVWQGQLLIPQVLLGNVSLVCLPPRGLRDNPEALYHDLSVPPTHSYIAFYLWLQRGFHADALIHFGTHGSHEFLPRKQQGLSATDWPDLLIQDLPNIYPYMCVNAVEAITAKRRGYAVIVSHTVPPLRATGLTPALEELHRLIRGYESAEGEALREEYKRQILRQAGQAAMAGIEIEDSADFDGLVNDAHVFLHRLMREEAPLGLHVLGEQPAGKALVSTVLPMLHGELENALAGKTKGKTAAHGRGRHQARCCTSVARAAALRLLEAVIQQGLSPERAQLRTRGYSDERITRQLSLAQEYARRWRDSDEIGGILHALRGGYLPSGIGGCPIRNPEVLPAGRNMHSVDPSAIPTRPAWEVGKKLAADLLSQYQRDGGRVPRKVGFVLFGGETIRHQGIMESQILFLLGVQPVWGGRGGHVVDLRLIPGTELGRPRVDVVITTTGQYRDVFGEVMALLQRAVGMAAQAGEKTNYVRENTRAIAAALRKHGYDDQRAQALAATRVFAPAVGVYSTGLEAAVAATKTWKADTKLAKLYLERMGFAYGREKAWGKKDNGLFATVLQGTEAAVFSRSSKLYGLLDTDHPFGFLGGMSLAVRHLDGAAPKLYITNLRAANQPEVEAAQRFMAMEAQTRYLNPGWIREMKKAGYSGAGEMVKWVHDLWGWQVTAPTAVDPRLWRRAYQVYVNDEYRLGLRQWLQAERPDALTSIAQTMLEAVNRHYWRAPVAVRARLAALAGTRGWAQVSIVPLATRGRGRAIPTIHGRHARLPSSRTLPFRRSPEGGAAKSLVRGRKLVEQAWSPPPPLKPPAAPSAPLVAVLVGLFVAGFLKRVKERK